MLWDWKAEPADCYLWWANRDSSFKETTIELLYMQAKQPTFTWISNHLWLDKKKKKKKKTSGEPSERENEMWQRSCVNWIPFIATLKERKKQEVTSKMPNLKVLKWCKCVLRIEYQKYRTMESERCWECNL